MESIIIITLTVLYFTIGMGVAKMVKKSNYDGPEVIAVLLWPIMAIIVNFIVD